ncbi:MAG: UDP-N-acetylmuramate dehydrogenase [Alsobacter sp.]
MAFSDITHVLAARMPGLRGSMVSNAPLAPLSWFRTGGPAQVLFQPADEADLALFMAGLPAGVPALVIGLGSNLLVRDGGLPGVAIRLGKGFQDITVTGPLRIAAGAGAADVKVARVAAEAGIAGLSFLRGIPGTIGGALRMNGGAYGGEVKDVLASCRGVGRDGVVRAFDTAAMGFTYRHCAVADDVVFTHAVFEGRPGDPAAILAEMAAITETRQATQPVNTRTGGSTFKNPPGAKAWELVDRAGCRGLMHGGAQVSPLHCNFLVAHAGATAADVEALGEEVRRRVLESAGVTLEWEIKRVGLARPADREAGR